MRSSEIKAGEVSNASMVRMEMWPNSVANFNFFYLWIRMAISNCAKKRRSTRQVQREYSSRCFRLILDEGGECRYWSRIWKVGCWHRGIAIWVPGSSAEGRKLAVKWYGKFEESWGIVKFAKWPNGMVDDANLPNEEKRELEQEIRPQQLAFRYSDGQAFETFESKVTFSFFSAFTLKKSQSSLPKHLLSTCCQHACRLRMNCDEVSNYF